MKRKMFVWITVCLLVFSLIGAAMTAHASGAQEYEYLYKKGSGRAPGYWYHDSDITGGVFTVMFEAQNYFNGIYGFYYAPVYDIPILVTVYNDRGNEAWSEVVTFNGDNEKTISFDKVMKPGYYEVTYEIQEIDLDDFHSKVSGNPYWVMSSSGANEDRDDVFFDFAPNGLTNESTMETPELALLICEPDPNAEEEPTAEPTAEPTEEPTAEPTAAPEETKAPAEETKAPVSTQTAAAKTPAASQSGSDSEDSNTGLIIGIAACAVVIVAIVVVVIIMVRKSKKK